MSILIQNEQQDVTLDLVAIEQRLAGFLQQLNLSDWSLSVSFVDVIHSSLYNSKYRQKNGPADVLSFPFTQLQAGDMPSPTADGIRDLGDLILCPVKILSDINQLEAEFPERLERLLVHGLLHLLGYDHHTDADYAVMKSMEEQLLGYPLDD